MSTVAPETMDKVRRVARYQRWMILLLILWLLVQSYVIATYGQHRSILEHLVILLVFLASLGSVFLLAKELNHVVVAFIGTALVAVPVLSLLVMYAVNYSAIEFLQQRGIKVGFLGVSHRRI
jgi:hypothetical protein